MRYWISVVVSFAFAFDVLSPYAQCSYVCSIKAFILWQSIGVFFLLCCLVSRHCLELTCIGAKHVLCTKSIMHTHTHTTYISINWTIAYSHHYGRWSGIFYSCGDANHIHPMRFISGVQERITEQTTGTKCIITFYIQAQFMTIRSASHAKLDDYCHPQPTSSLLYSLHSPLTCALDFDCFFVVVMRSCITLPNKLPSSFSVATISFLFLIALRRIILTHIIVENHVLSDSREELSFSDYFVYVDGGDISNGYRSDRAKLKWRWSIRCTNVHFRSRALTPWTRPWSTVQSVKIWHTT